MGSKGSPTVTNTAQTYMANPAIQGAANQAITGAQTAAAQPFQMPVAPVAGFNPTQNTAFGSIGAAQGQAQPYYNEASQYFNAAATPITASDVSQYYNPMASNVTAQLQNIYGEQNAQNTGNLTQTAGGVGADRIAVGQGDLANQQTLAAGQVYSNLYQQALQQAQLQKTMAAGAGSNLAGLGTTAEQTALSGAGTLLGAGNQQQAQTQAQLNAPYQNTLAQIAYQFQTPQYLAGITGGLSGALGGTTTGNQVTTPPQPTALAQILGLGTAGVGLYGALGGQTGSGGMWNSVPNTGAINNSMNTLNNNTGGSFYGPGFARGGEVEGYDDGGASQPPPMPGTSLPAIGGNEGVPYIPMSMTQGHSGPLVGAINTAPQTTTGSSHQETLGGDISQAMGIAAKVIPFLKRGGVAGYDDGGPTPNLPGPDFDPSRPINAPAPASAPWPFNSARTIMGGNGTMVPYNTDPDVPFAKVDPSVQPPDHPPTPMTDPRKSPLPGPSKKAVVTSAGPGNGAAEAAASGFTPPYPDALARDKGQDIARSPWMGLIKAGATIAATPGPIGSAIGKGILAGAGTIEGQRKELRSEQELNDKAQQLYQHAQQHLDKYNKLTANEKATLAFKYKELDQSGAGGEGGLKEIDIQRAMNPLNTHPSTLMLPPDEKRILATHALKSGSYVGAKKEFDDGKGGKTVGVWNGQKWAPAE